MDKELDDLLDSALGDFDQKLTIKDEKAAADNSKSKVSIEKMNIYVDDDLDYEDRPAPQTQKAPTSTATGSKTNTPLDPLGNLMTDDNLKIFEGIFSDEMNKNSMKDFKNVFDAFQNSSDEAALLNNFQKVMTELVNEESNLDSDTDDFDNIQELDFLKNLAAAADMKAKNEENKESKVTAENPSNTEAKKEKTPMQKVLDDMNKNSEKVLKNSANSGFPFGSDFLSSLTQSLNADENATGSDGLDGATSMMMQPILSMLFSKEILYPSLKMMLENYDKYIEEKKEKITEEELNKCQEQKEYIGKMCAIYEASSTNDSKEGKAEQLKDILDLLEKCGMPPAELVPEVNPFEGLGDQMKQNGCPVS